MESRSKIWEELGRPWDVIVIGGGITGAGVFREAAALGLRCLLLEQRDFAWGTSSRSGKLVHGGLRYLSQGQLKTTWHSITARENLLRERSGLVEPLGFLAPDFESSRLEPLMLKAGLAVYDLLAARWSHRRYGPGDMLLMAPGLKEAGLSGGYRYHDARTDDARLVLRIIREGARLGGAALNYAPVKDLCRERAGRVRGVLVGDGITGATREVYGQVIINATGVWVDQLRSRLGAPLRMRPLRGSHLIFPHWRIPLAQAVSFRHPRDGRYIYVFPWEGVTLAGTTDVDHEASLDHEPRISKGEGSYLLEGVREIFPSRHLTERDVLSTFAGVRPVVNTGKKDPSRESRDHCVWTDQGMVTVTGGKLTTFGILARETMARARKWLSSPAGPAVKSKSQYRTPGNSLLLRELGGTTLRRLAGRYGDDLEGVINEIHRWGPEFVPGTGTLWAELSWSAAHEEVAHLEDLLLRRVRLGLLLPRGGHEILRQIGEKVAPLLGWDTLQWKDEATRYQSLWREAYSPDLLFRQD